MRGFRSVPKRLIDYYESNQEHIGKPAFLPATLAVMGLTAPLKLCSYHKAWPELSSGERVITLVLFPFELLSQLFMILIGLYFGLVFVVMTSLYILKAKITHPNH